MQLRIRPWLPLTLLALPIAAVGFWLLAATGPQSLAAYLASCLLIFVVIAMLARSWRAALLTLTPALVLAAAFALHLFFYRSLPGELFAYVLATSTWQEIWGFFGLWQGLRWLLLFIVLVSLYVALSIFMPARPVFSPASARGRWILIGVAVILGAYSALNSAALIAGVAANPLVGTAFFVLKPLAHAHAAVSGRAISKVDFHATRVGAEEVHVLVIGESARRDSWSVYGYPRATTPYLESLRGEAIFFQHAMADANFTVCVVPILLTGMRPDQFSMEHIHGNLVDLAQQAGYETAWLMNQDPHISLLSGVHADRMLYPPAISTLIAGHLPMDQVLLPPLDQELLKTGKPRFIGLHTIGSHWLYSSRYPPSFARFGSAKDLTYESAGDINVGSAVLDAYDNSVLYTDWFLHQVIERVRKLTVPATVTYFADHGEDLYALDGNTGHGTAIFTAHQFAIPAFIWMNDAYRAAHPERVAALQHNAALEIRSHNLFYSMAEIMGINRPGDEPSESFASGNFSPDVSSPHIAGDHLVELHDTPTAP